MPDLRRREPRNVGVVVTDGDRVLSRFLGEDESGALLPLNRVSGPFESKKTYRSWWNHWQRTIDRGITDADDLPSLLVPDVASNYVCELAMVELAGAPAALGEFLDEAWIALVQSPRELDGEDSEDDLVEVSNRLISPFYTRPGFHVYRDKTLSVYHRDERGRYEASLHFHYMIQNGKWNHFRRLKLTGDDTLTWSRVHLTVRLFEGLTESPDVAHRDSNKIAFVQIREGHTEAEKQLREVERLGCHVVPVDDEHDARQTLDALVGG